MQLGTFQFLILVSVTALVGALLAGLIRDYLKNRPKPLPAPNLRATWFREPRTGAEPVAALPQTPPKKDWNAILAQRP